MTKLTIKITKVENGYIIEEFYGIRQWIVRDLEELRYLITKL